MIHIDKSNMMTSGLILSWIILVVGRETVLASPGSHELRCGRRLVSGLFSRPRLPLGYSYIATVPRGACRLNITEIFPSDNYIALKISNGSYIMNGEFAVSLPGNYNAAGARFLYTRTARLDQVFAYGPILYPIDIMILYTEPNPSIKYEYLIDSLPNDGDEAGAIISDATDFPFTVSKHSRRHHNYNNHVGVTRQLDIVDSPKDDIPLQENIIGDRRFIWKIISFSQCSRACGGGIQLGKFRCIEVSDGGTEVEVSSMHCSGLPPVGKRRRCNNIPCPPRWRAAAWSLCPKCGPANRTRIVGCVQDHSRGITKISDLKCPPLKPTTVEKCDIPDCEKPIAEVRLIEPKRIKAREHIDTFRQGPVYTVAVNNTEIDVGPEYSFSAVAGWLYSEWSECKGWCVGGGIQTRSVRCADPSGCSPRQAPETFRTCTPNIQCPPQDGKWFVGEWSKCTSPCKGKQIRGVLCVGGTGRHLKDSGCKGPRPESERDCVTEEPCAPSWFLSDWGKCTSNCSSIPSAVQRRSVVCARGDAVESRLSEVNCTEYKPLAQKACEHQCTPISTLPPSLTIESQKAIQFREAKSSTETFENKNNFNEIKTKECNDQLQNCFLAVQARLCHYSYYAENCCNSCRKGR